LKFIVAQFMMLLIFFVVLRIVLCDIYYVSSDGLDSNNCSEQSSSCFSISYILSIAFENEKINILILVCEYTTNPILFREFSMIEIGSSEGSETTLSWNISYSQSGSLFTTFSSNLTVKYITILHNSESKGPIFEITGNSYFILEVCFSYCNFIFYVYPRVLQFVELLHLLLPSLPILFLFFQEIVLCNHQLLLI
jgi:hypothetical protein